MLIIDRREITEHSTIPQMIAVPYASDTLDSADYMFMDRNMELVGIERCEIGNFVQKLHSGELKEQMDRCTKAYKTTIVLIESPYNKSGDLLATYKEGSKGYFLNYIYPHTRMDEIVGSITRISEYGIEIFQSPNLEGSAMFIRLLHNQRTESEELATLFKKIRANRMPVKYSGNPQVSKLMSLGNRLPEKIAIELIAKFGSIWNLLNAPEKEVLEVKGMGKSLLQSIKNGIGKQE